MKEKKRKTIKQIIKQIWCNWFHYRYLWLPDDKWEFLVCPYCNAKHSILYRFHKEEIKHCSNCWVEFDNNKFIIKKWEK